MQRQSHCPRHTPLCLKIRVEKKKLNEPENAEIRQNACLWAKHKKLQSVLLQAQQGAKFDSKGSQQMGSQFVRPWYINDEVLGYLTNVSAKPIRHSPPCTDHPMGAGIACW